MQGILELDIVSGSGVGHGTPERSNYRDSRITEQGHLAVLVWLYEGGWDMIEARSTCLEYLFSEMQATVEY